jgi:putative transposase
MSRRANPYDHAQVESFSKTLEHEEVLAYDLRTLDDVRARLPYLLEEVSNRRGFRSALGYLPPAEFEALSHGSAA